MNRQKALNQYRNVDNASVITQANPHQLIQMLFQGVIDRVSSAKGAMIQNDHEQTGKYIKLAVGIVGGLQSSLELKIGGEVAENLNNLYEYIQRRLLEGQLKHDPVVLDEVIALVKEIKSAWDKLPEILQAEQQATMTETTQSQVAPVVSHPQGIKP